MPEAIIVGAGAAGLICAAALTREGVDVTLLEARDRLGGRIYTLHDPSCDVPLELGAEFVHGRPPEIFRLVEQHELDVREVAGEDFCHLAGTVAPCEFFEKVDELLSRMKDVKREQSFDDFLAIAAHDAPPQIKRWARGYIQGFNAAPAEEISLQSLLREAEAEDKIDGQRAYRVVGGYENVIKRLLADADPARLNVQLNCPVRRIAWSRGKVEIETAGVEFLRFHAAAAVITLPLGVLQSGEVLFDPQLPQKRGPLAHIAMGQAMRVTLRFSRRFWADTEVARVLPAQLDNLRFLFTLGEWFPTWWTASPLQAPLITAWAPAHCAERFAGQSENFIVDKALAALAEVFPLDRKELDSAFAKAYLHDWQSDPYSRGAYSYVRVGGLDTPAELAAPVEGTLFFAGEATENEGHHATVHGAIASGLRAAREVLNR